MQGRLGAPHSEGFWAHVFPNGLYWGMYAVTERIDDDFCASHYGGDKEEWDVVKVEEFEAGNTVQPADGTLDKWHEMRAMADLDATSTTALYRLEGLDSRGARDSTLEPLLDIDNFLDYMIINQYAGNNDWDYHNWFAIRRRTNPQTGFQFLCWDSEAIFEGGGDNVLKPSGSHGGKLTDLFVTLMGNVHFRRRFADHVWALCSSCGPLSPDSSVTPSAANSDGSPILVADDDIRDRHVTIRYVTKVSGEWSATASHTFPVAAPTDMRALPAAPRHHGRL